MVGENGSDPGAFNCAGGAMPDGSRTPSGAAVATAERTVVIDEPGGPVQWDRFEIPRDEYAVFAVLSYELRIAAGSAKRSAGANYDPVVVDPRRHRTLRESDPADVAEAIRTTMRFHPGWKLPGDYRQDPLVRIDHYYKRFLRR
jgi:hypothetical protein